MDNSYTPQEGTLTDEDMQSAMLTQLSAVMGTLEELDIDSELHMNEEGVPFLIVKGEDRQLRLIGVPVDDTLRRYMLLVTTAVIDGIEEDVSIGVNMDAMALCAQYNMSSVIGYAVYLPPEGMIELRAQQLYEGGAPDAQTLEAYLTLFYGSASELVGLWDEMREDN
ncbi:MAG: hypothetical protein IJT32_01795 [Lachnospiraceae bacterium]|nr:hypothetical protein [Lachnospiraceae bacterium]